MWGDCWFGDGVSATEKCSWKDTCSGLIAFVGTSSLLGRKRSDSHLGDGYVGIYAGGLYTPILRRAW